LTAAHAPANAEEIRRWNEICAASWLANQTRIDRMLEGLGRAALAAAGARTGESVLDVGCGAGASTLALARAVGPGGSVTGVDPAAPLLARARERAAAEGLAHVAFVEADAQAHAFEPGAFELLFSRFGVMFFADPEAAFRNLARALAPGARLAFVCWQALDRNPWLGVPMGAAARVVPLPPRPAPGAPGPFAFADAERVRAILEAAGFESVRADEESGDILLDDDLDAAAEFALALGPAAAALREAGAGARERALPEVRAALAPFAGSAGVRLPFAAWIFRARRGNLAR
jgi:SAM-dependent methyltransferase